VSRLAAARLSSSTMRRTEFARRGTSGPRQAPQCFIATLGAFEDFAGDVPPCHMLLAAVRKDLTCPFEGDFHVGQGPSKLPMIMAVSFILDAATPRRSINQVK
jgi:hypothetical protein